ncbi:MAG: CvpA family protein [Muribaculaceae bacterium]|nr:CvpA family protein [Muribaculaceae bacterium]MDE5971641.1 CvpA family protein [Muribaculaceae bacterium]MDE6509392.1 CvpA family protein [Muribaculaceae bacterium]MDE7143715.1 CvpA family protein [Muribaculaceae bacterium]
MTPQNITDIIMIIGAVGFACWGAWRGAIRQIGWLAAFLCSFFVAKICGPGLASALGISLIISYIALFVMAFIVVSLIFRLLRFTVHLLLMGPLDRAAGLVAGIFKWLLFASLLLNILFMCNPRWPIFGSVLASRAMHLVPWLFGVARGYIG